MNLLLSENMILRTNKGVSKMMTPSHEVVKRAP